MSTIQKINGKWVEIDTADALPKQHRQYELIDGKFELVENVKQTSKTNKEIPQETKDKMSKAKIGKTFTEEHKQNMSKSQKERSAKLKELAVLHPELTLQQLKLLLPTKHVKYRTKEVLEERMKELPREHKDYYKQAVCNKYKNMTDQELTQILEKNYKSKITYDLLIDEINKRLSK